MIMDEQQEALLVAIESNKNVAALFEIKTHVWMKTTPFILVNDNLGNKLKQHVTPNGNPH